MALKARATARKRRKPAPFFSPMGGRGGRKRKPKRDKPEMLALGIMAVPFILAWELGKAAYKAGQFTGRGVQRVGGLLLRRRGKVGQKPNKQPISKPHGKGGQKPGEQLVSRPRNRQGQFMPQGVVTRLAPAEQPSKSMMQSLNTPSPAMTTGTSMKA